MRFTDYTVLELALVVRDSKANPNAYDKDAREALRRVCRIRITDLPQQDFLKKYPHATDQELARQAWTEIQQYARPPGYTSGVW
jgi:hypothetical protein